MCLLLTSKIREENCFSMLHGLLLKVYKSYEAIRCFLFLVSVTTFKLVIMHHLHVKTESHVFFKWTIRVLWCHAEKLITKFMKTTYIGYLKCIFPSIISIILTKYAIVNDFLTQDLKRVVLKNDKVGINFI